MDAREDELSVAANEYNAFEKLRDPSHVRCLTLNEWTNLIAASGLSVRAFELQDKGMGVESWADQMQASAQTKEQLRRMVFEGSSAFQAFMRPQRREADFGFTLVEGLIVADRAIAN